jgi:hypothetical protein
MADEPRSPVARGPLPERYAAVLLGAAALVLLVVPWLPAKARPWLTLFGGASAAATLAVFAYHERLSALRRVLKRGERDRGGIEERVGDDGRVVLELPGRGLEPWGSDAWAMLLFTLTLVGIAVSLDAFSFAFSVLIGALIVALGLRLRAARRDVIRIELDDRSWSIFALEGGRSVNIRGKAALLPELLPEALLLWSDQGRIGTIRWELAAEERAWLAERLLSLAAARGSLGESSHEVDQAEPDHHGQRQEREHTQ